MGETNKSNSKKIVFTKETPLLKKATIINAPKAVKKKPKKGKE